MSAIKLNQEWLDVLSDEFEQTYMQQLKAFLTEQKQLGKTVYPKGCDIFNALDSTPISQVKVVIIGQDPYHGPNQAHGFKNFFGFLDRFSKENMAILFNFNDCFFC